MNNGGDYLKEIISGKKLNAIESAELIKKIVENKLKKIPIKQVKIAIKEILNNISNHEYEDLKNKYSSLMPLDWSEVIELSKIDGCTIGSHCLDHICCHENQEEDVILNQFTKSKKLIEKKIGKSCDYIAFPNGDYTEFAKKASVFSGYSLAFTTERNKIINRNLDKSAIPRMGAARDMPRFKFFVHFYMNKLAGKLFRFPRNFQKKYLIF